ncbi:MAG: hypothetical protein FJ388_11790 [Verrucomicrobia bacterium]|nr:hypothetical protein [Verrucomicrobiota bacterium]
MKTARETTTKFPPRLPPPEELDKLILDFIGRGMDRASSDAEFNRLALALFRHQFAHNAPYRRYCESLGCNPHSVAHWTRIPAVPTTAFKDAALTTLRPAERVTVFHSSGTTEQRPSRHFHSRETLALYEASLWPMFEARVLKPVAAVYDRRLLQRGISAVIDRRYRDYRLIILTSTPSKAPHSSLVHMFETIRRRLGAPPSAFTGAAALEGRRALAAAVHSTIRNPQSAILLLGTAFAFVRLLDTIKSLPLPPGSRVMETGGYKGRSREVPRGELHALIASKLGVPLSAIVSEYGMCELSSQFYAGGEVGSPGFSRPGRPLIALACKPAKAGTPNRSRGVAGPGVFHGPPWTRVQVINPETGGESRNGERGLIRIFDLANRASVLAIQTEDVGIRRGDGFELIGRAPQAEARGCSLVLAS